MRRSDPLGLNLAHHPDLAEVVIRVIAWYESGCGALVLAGNPGCGKTHIARRIFEATGGPFLRLPQGLNYQAKTFVPEIDGIFTTEADLLGDIRGTYSGQDSEEKILARYQRTRVLIIDDVLMEGNVKVESMPWYQARMVKVIEPRAARNMPTLFTTNQSAAAFKGGMGARAWSRLRGMGIKANFINMFDIPDYREVLGDE